MTAQPTSGDAATVPDPAPPAPGRELEIKLVGEPRALDRLFDHPAVRRQARGRARSAELVSTYFDTVDGRLTRRGVNLRVRRKGDLYVQTVKTDPVEGFLRREWETPVGGPEPELEALDSEARSALGLILPHELRPVFSTHFRRRIRQLVTEDGAEAELALDRGTIRTARGEQPIAEIEIELKSGRPEALYDLALELHGLAPTRILVESKAERGYALAGIGEGRPSGAALAEPLHLDPDQPASAAFAAIGWNCLRHWLANEAGVMAGTVPEAVHQMRVALRRLRSALGLFRGVIDETAARSWSAELKWLADTLGPSRDLDVFAAEILGPVAAALREDPAVSGGLDTLGAATAAARAQAGDEARLALVGPRYASLLLGLCRWLAGPVAASPAGPAAEAFARKVLQSRLKKVLKAGAGFDTLPIEQRHEVRIRLKKLRYAVEFFQSLYSGRLLKPYLKVLKAMQDDLGHLNDVAVAEALLARIRPSLPADAAIDRSIGTILGWHGRHAHEIEPKMRRDWAAFAGARPFWDRR